MDEAHGLLTDQMFGAPKAQTKRMYIYLFISSLRLKPTSTLELAANLKVLTINLDMAFIKSHI